MHRREGENVRKRGWENAWRSEKGERRRMKHIHEREWNGKGGGLRGENTSALDRRIV